MKKSTRKGGKWSLGNWVVLEDFLYDIAQQGPALGLSWKFEGVKRLVLQVTDRLID